MPTLFNPNDLTNSHPLNEETLMKVNSPSGWRQLRKLIKSITHSLSQSNGKFDSGV